MRYNTSRSYCIYFEGIALTEIVSCEVDNVSSLQSICCEVAILMSDLIIPNMELRDKHSVR